ncbi:MAG: hypothetical protein LKJ90_07740 [Faecalibacterium sp.]|nr:hypothetical protein [Faecalibacterium sp.]
MKKKLLLLSMIACILAVATVGVTLAYATTTSGTITGNYDTPTLAVKLSAENTAVDAQADADQTTALNQLVPGGAAQKIGYTAENTDSTSEYVCVTITKYWTKDGEKDTSGATNPSDIILDGLDTLAAGDAYGGTEWIVLRKSAEQIVLVHTGHLESNAATGSFLDSVRLSERAGLANQGYQPEIRVSAQAVQYLAGNDTVNTNAILAAWGTQATIVDGTITAVTL